MTWIELTPTEDLSERSRGPDAPVWEPADPQLYTPLSSNRSEALWLK